jgi:hypothetical protein
VRISAEEGVVRNMCTREDTVVGLSKDKFYLSIVISYGIIENPGFQVALHAVTQREK